MIPKGSDVLVNYPGMGSLWLTGCDEQDGHVIGSVWTDEWAGDVRYSVPLTMNFPLTCVRKIEP